MRTYWDELARRCFVSRDYVKVCAYVLLYKGSIDPWLDSIISAEITALMKERGL